MYAILYTYSNYALIKWSMDYLNRLTNLYVAIMREDKLGKKKLIFYTEKYNYYVSQNSFSLKAINLLISQKSYPTINCKAICSTV